MPSVARSERRGWFGPALALVAAVTAARIALLALDRTDVFVDEAQYWFWGQHLAFGYYSKPPLIGWVIRAATTLAGSDSAFFLRLPAPLLHGATALILAALAARLYGARAAVWVAVGFVTLPIVAVASLLISTDTVMFPFLALALLAWLAVLERRGTGEPAAGLAAAAGLALGLGFMAKYAAVYFLGSALLAALLMPEARPRPRDAVLALVVLALTITPNILWNVLNGLPTLHHTMDNVDWIDAPETRTALRPMVLLTFWAAQAVAVGPVVFALLIGLGVRWRRVGPADRLMAIFALPALAVVSVQALVSHAYANWAAVAYLAGSVAVFAALSRRPRLRAVTLALNGAICLALPLLTLWPEALVMPNGRPLLGRFIGRAEVTHKILDAARAASLTTVVADGRDILADLFYTGRDSGVTIYAVPPKGLPTDHYEMTRAFPKGRTQGDVLFVTASASDPCALPQDRIGAIATSPRGAYKGRTIGLYRVPASCF